MRFLRGSLNFYLSQFVLSSFVLSLFVFSGVSFADSRRLSEDMMCYSWNDYHGGYKRLYTNGHCMLQEAIFTEEKEWKSRQGHGQAGTSQRFKAIEALREHSADPNRLETLGGYTALMGAVIKGWDEVVLELLKYGARLNTRNDSGTTALMLAAGRTRFPREPDDFYSDPHLRIIKILLEQGAKINVRNDNGVSVLDMVSDSRYREKSEICEILSSYGCSEDLCDCESISLIL